MIGIALTTVIWSAVLTKYSKTEVTYRLAAAGAKRRCGTCRMFEVANRDCAAVEGGIEANYVCNIWKLKVPSLKAWEIIALNHSQ